eukprot:6650519-Prymnesium_polylepis.1
MSSDYGLLALERAGRPGAASREGDGCRLAGPGASRLASREFRVQSGRCCYFGTSSREGRPAGGKKEHQKKEMVKMALAPVADAEESNEHDET